MAGGGKSSTSTSAVTIPPDVLARYNSVNATAQNVAQTPFQPYSSNPSDFVAPVNSTQQQGINQIAGSANAAQPFFGAAAGLTAAGAGPANLGGLNTNQYMSPFMGDVYGQALAGQQLQNQQQQSNLAGQAVTAGAFGGDRANTAQANLAYQQNLANNQTNANLLNTGYQNAQNVATQQQGAQLAAQQANLARLTGAGGQLAGIGTAAQTAAQQGGQNALAAGTVPQQTQQAGLTALYNQFLQQQAYPFQTTQFLANIAEGTGALSGSNTTTTQPSSFFSDRRLKHDIKKIGKTDDGLPIYKFKYKGDPSEQTHVGFMAQDVEKVHPEAVGESHGYKTVDYDKATRHARYAGGLIPHHMGGEVNEGHMGEEYARGGYALNGAVTDPYDMAAILAAQQHMYAPFSESGMGITGTPGAGRGIVPAANLPVPKLVIANPHFTQQPTGMQQMQGAENAGNMVSGLYYGGKKGLLGAPASTYTQDGKTYQQAASTGLVGAGGNYDPKKGWLGPSDTPAAAAPAAAPDAAPAPAAPNADTPLPQYRGGLVREHHADGNAAGDDTPYDNSTAGGYMSGLGLSGSTLSPQQLKSEQTDMAASKMPGQPPSGAMQGLQAASALYTGAKLAGKGYDAAASAIGKLGASPAAYSEPIGPGMANMPGGLLPAGGGTAAPAGVAGAAAPAAEAAAPAAAAATPAIEAGGLSGAAGGAGAAEAAGAGAEAAGAAGAAAADAGAAAAGTAATAGLADAGASAAGSTAMDLLPLLLANRGGVVPRAHRADGGPADGGSVDLDALLNTRPSDQAASVVDPFNPDLGGGVPADVAAATSAGKPADVVAATSAGKPAGLGPAARVAQAAPVAPSAPQGNENADPIEAIWPRLIGQESGGKQFNPKTGQPLTSSKGAVGIAQVMPGTAPEAAKLAGLNYDENLYRNDAGYNAALGKAYLKDQYRKFGDPQLAAAAYNAGPDAVQRAQQRAQESGQPVMSYLPLETQNYVASIFNGSPARQAVQPSAPQGGIMSSIGNGLANAGHAVSNFFSPSQANAQTPNQQGGQQQQGTDWEKILVPLASGLAGMASSPSRYLGSAILQGLGAGATGYENVMANEANRAQTGAQTNVQQTVAAHNAIDIYKNSSYLDPATGAPMVILEDAQRVTRVQWIKMGSPPLMGQREAAAAINKMSGTPSPAQSTVQPPVAPPNAPAPGGTADPAPATPWGLGAAGRARVATDAETMANSPFQKNELTAQNAALNKQVSDNYANAGDTTAMLNNLTKQILAEPDSGIASAGAISGIKNIALNGWNSIMSSIPGGGGDQYKISPNEMNSAIYQNKIAAGLAFAQSNKASQNNLQGLATALSAQPGNTIPKPVALNIVSSLYADKQKAIDEYKYLQEYREAAVSDPNGMGLYSTQNARAAFNQEHNSQQYATEKHAFRNLLAPVDANDNPVGKPPPMLLDATGKPVHLFNLAVNPELTPRGPKILPQIERYAGSPGLTRWMRNN